mmetsp:Transcript_9526/g.24668  ORF Transcript_9526/g.24668 Transcript_9526/m.24668 type:complete len:163 (-) Transcript_9526:197-685(-)
MNKREYYAAKFGPERAAQIMSDSNPIKQRFREVGVELSYNGNTGNTFDGHRLLTHAEMVGGSELQGKLAEELFVDYFTREKTPAARDTLLAAAERAGVPDAQRVIDDKGACAEETKAQMRTFGRGVRGVPHFIVEGGKVVFSGAQPPDAWAEVLEEVTGDTK